MIKFRADSVQVRNSKVGDEVTVTFTTGIYEWDNLKDIIKLNGEAMVVEVKEENDSIKSNGKTSI
jgi:hypothetical protein